MKILVWIIVALVIVGGLVWFLSSPSTEETSNTTGSSDTNNENQVTQGSSISSDEDVFAEIDAAMEDLE